MAITRIKTNQITDLNVTTAKLAANAVTAAKLEDNLTYGSNLTVTGNLTVNGTSSTINSTTMTVDDPVILLAPDATGSGALDLGFMGERGSDTNIAFVWDESADEFVAAFTSSTDSSTTITVTDYADLRVGGMTIDDNATVGGTLGVTGTLTASGGLTVAASQTISAGSNKITNVADPTNAQDAATKAYVDAELSAGWVLSDGSNTQTIDVSSSDTLTVSGTANEITTAVSATDTLTIGLPNDVTIGNDLTVTNDCTVSNDLTVTGNLTVNGTTTTVASTNTTVSDNLLELNSGATSNANDAGIIIERGSTGDNAILAWDESADGFIVGTTTATASSTGDLTITAAAFQTGALTSTTGDFSGAVGIDGDFDIATNKFTVASASGNTAIAGTLAVTGVATFTAESVHNGGIQLNDSDTLTLGTDDDATLVHNGSSLALTNGTGILSIDGAAGSAIRVNEAGADVDFVVEGDTVASLFVVDAGTDTVNINGATPTADATLNIGGTDSFVMPKGTTAERPASPVTGCMRWSTTNTGFEYYDGSTWKNVTADFTVIVADSFNGDGSTVAFTLTNSGTTANTIVSINGVVQIPTTAYAVSGTTLTFTEAPATGDVIDVRSLTTTSQVVGIDDGAGNASITANGDGSIDVVGTLAFNDGDGSNWVGFTAPTTVAADVTWTLPSADAATSGYALVSDGAGTLSWAAAGATISQDNTSNTAFNLYYAAGTSGALTAVKYDGGTLTFNPSTETLACTNFSGTASSAQYADLAEIYTADGEIEPGTVVCFGGDAEVTVCDHDMDRKVAGVVSTNPAYLMNSEADGVAVALQGRVPCKVTGAVSKGDMMVSAGNGMARAEENPTMGSVIGKALQDHDGGEGVIEVAIGRL